MLPLANICNLIFYTQSDRLGLHQIAQFVVTCFRVQGTNCGIVDWYDPLMCARSVKIIPGLLRNMNGLQAMVATKQAESRRLKMMLGFSWLVIVLYFLLN
uniref:Zinc finger, GRF-type n=1 Tax=Tanacetum cinerariifolium TaxID=118510 RepID=A0A6L2NUE2_TANCI|nr:zinc finger, GRF-type [Tanacetum cinerariifolium]